VRFVRPLTRRAAVRRVLVVVGLVVGVLAVGGGLGGFTAFGAGRALAATTGPAAGASAAVGPSPGAGMEAPPGSGVPLAGSASATLSQVTAREWTTTVDLDTAALCAGSKPAGNKFTLVTGKPDSVTGAAAPAYPDGPLDCAAAAADPVTEVQLTFAPAPAMSAVPETATLTVTPPQALLLAGDPPLQIPLTVRRSVSPWQYVGIPAICGGALALLLILTLMAIGVPARRAAQAGPEITPPEPEPAPASVPAPASLPALATAPASASVSASVPAPTSASAAASAPALDEPASSVASVLASAAVPASVSASASVPAPAVLAPSPAPAPAVPPAPAPASAPAPVAVTASAGPARVDINQLVLLFLMAKQREVLVTDWPVFSEPAPAVPRHATAMAAGPGPSGPETETLPGAEPREQSGGGPASTPAVPRRETAVAHAGVVAHAGTGAGTEHGTRPEAGPAAQTGTEHETGSGAGRAPERVHWGLDFWRTPLFAGVAWSFGDSWATSVTPLTALAGGVLTASGAVAGLVPGVDLTRFGLLMALVGALTTFAPLLFNAVNSLFPPREAGAVPPDGEVIAARLWVMLFASCLTVFAIGAEIGFVGLVLGFNLIVTSPSVRWLGPAGAALAALLFLAYGTHSILTLTAQPSGSPKTTARKSSFMI
jgi:hypothetical protein